MTKTAFAELKKRLRREVRPFHAKAWFNAVAHDMKDDSPSRLENALQPWKMSFNDYGKLVPSRSWDRYKAGAVLPKDGHEKSGNPLSVLAAATSSPESVWIYRHPLWQTMKSPFMSLSKATQLISTFEPKIANYYLDLTKSKALDLSESLAGNICLDIWIDWNDRHAAMDHLAASLMFLKIDGLRHLEDRREKCAENIAKSLGPLASSHWIGTYYEEMFDWLEKNIWGDLFDNHYRKGDQQAKGWRKTKPKWLTTMGSEMIENVDLESLEKTLRDQR